MPDTLNQQFPVVDDAAKSDNVTDRASLRLMLDHAPDGVFIIGADGLYYVNAALADLLGRSVEQLTDPKFDWLQCIHPEDREGVLARLDDRLAGHPQQPRHIYRIVTPVGDVRYLEMSVGELPSSPPKLLGLARDITLRFELEAANRRTQELVVIVAQASQLLSVRQVAEPEVTEALDLVRAVIGADRACVQVTTHETPLDYEHMLCHCVGPVARARCLRLPKPWHAALGQGELVLRTADNVPENERSILDEQGIRGMLTIPIIVDDVYRGFLHFDSISTEHAWSEEEQNALRTFGVVFSNALGHREADTRTTESEARFRRLVENAPDVIYRIGLPDGQCEYVSPASEEILGYTPEQYYEDPLLMQKAMHPGWLAAYDEQWAKLLRGEVPPVSAYAIVHGETGETRWLFIRNVLIRDTQGEPVAVEGIISDVTPQKLAETRLREREDTLQSILRAAPIGIGLNTDRTMLLVNDRVCQMTGYTVDELVGRTTRLLYTSQEEWERVGLELVAQLQVQESASIETQWRRKDGTLFDAFVTATCLTPEDYAAGVTFTVLDISEFAGRWQARGGKGNEDAPTA